MSKITLKNGDSLEILKELEDNSVDSVVTDPPYGLSFMGKKWDYDVPSVEIWKECLRVLKPGGYLLAFAGTRTQHRMAVNIEDAGFEIRDMIAWVYGSGFPKSHNIGKAVDKLQGNEGEDVEKVFPDGSKPRKTAKHFVGNEYRKEGVYSKGNSEWEGWGTALKPSHEDLTVARKPLETRSDIEYNKDICQKLYAGIVKKSSELNLQGQKEGVDIAQWIAEKNINTLEDLREVMDMLQSYTKENTNLNIVLSWLNILAELWEVMSMSIISTELNTTTELKILNSLGLENISANIINVQDNQTGGLNADVFNVESLLNALKLKLKHTLEHFAPENAILKAKLDNLHPNLEPITVARKPFKGTVAKNVLEHGTGGINIDGCRVEIPKDDKGGFRNGDYTFNCEATSYKMRDNGDSYRKDQHPQGRFPANLIHDGSEEVVELFPETKSGNLNSGHKRGDGTGNSFKGGGGIVSGNYGGDSGNASRFFYCAKASKKDRNEGLDGFEEKVRVRQGLAGEKKDTISKNSHPTVKPTKLMQYLVRLVTRKGGVVLDPFMGSGSTGKACKLEGMDFIGIDLDPDYVKIAEARINHVNE